MDLTGIGSIFDFGSKLLDKILPDPAQKAQAQLELLKLQQAGEFKQLDAQLAEMSAQTDINKVEAGSSNLFIAGWRPFCGWICGVGLAYQYVLLPLITYGYILYTGHGLPVPAPSIEDSLWQLLGGMLGLAGWRSWDKKNGVTR